MPVKAKPVSAEFFNFDENTLRRLAEEYGLPEIDEFCPILLDGDTCTLLEVRSETSRKMILGSSECDARFFLKQIPWYCDDAQLLAFSHSLQVILEDRGLPVPKIHRTRQGDTWLEIGDEKFALFEYVKGLRYKAIPEQIRSAAKVLARLHACDIRAQNPKSEDLFQLVREHIVLLQRSFERTGEFAQQIQLLTERLVQAGTMARAAGWEGLPHSAVHGDYNPLNLLFNEDGQVAAILDFDNCDTGPRLHDVAEALITFSYVEYRGDSTNFSTAIRTKCDETIVRCFLAAYESELPLSSAERESLPFILKAVMIELFCLGIVRRDYNTDSWPQFLQALDRIPIQIETCFVH